MVRLTGASTRSRCRVLMVCPQFLPHVGGVETHVFEVGRRLNDLGAEVEVLTTGDTRSLPARETIGGLPVRRVPFIQRSGEARIAPGLVPAIREGDWDLVHVQHFHAGIAPLALWAAHSRRIPAVVTFHGGGQRHWLRLRLWPPQPAIIAPFALDVSRQLLRKAQGLIAVAQFEIEDLARRLSVPKERFTLIPNGCELPRVARAGGHRDSSGPRLVSMGRLVKNKGHHRVLEAFAIVLAARPGASLWIAGSGPLEEQLRLRAIELGVSHRVEISSIPSSRRDDLAARLSTMHVLVAMSDFEAHPLGAIEALALGVPAVVANDHAGLRELAANGMARLVEIDAHPRQLAEAIMSTLDHPPDISAVAFPTWDDCARQTATLYEDVLTNMRRATKLPRSIAEIHSRG